jgi:hypothetical protein
MIVIFAGAGASKAVNPQYYPTTIEYFERLPESIVSNPLFQNVLGLLKHRKGDEAVVDIEEVLWILDDLGKFVHDIGDETTVTGWFINQGRLWQSLGQPAPNWKSLVDAAKRVIPAKNDLVDEINLDVYNHYARLPSDTELEECWLPLLRELLDRGQWLELFTTNYDRVLEQAIAVLSEDDTHPELQTGRVNEVNTYLDLSIWEEKPDEDLGSRSNGGLLTKLHGSVDWVRGEDRIFVGTPIFMGDHSRQAIIYPGFKGNSPLPPFSLFHDHFSRALRSADIVIVIVIGFSFRDDYINDLFSKSTRSDAKIFIVDPSDELAGVPFEEGRFEHLPLEFDRASVRQLVSSVDKTLQAK